MMAPTIPILFVHVDSIVSASPSRRASPIDCVYRKPPAPLNEISGTQLPELIKED